MRLIDQGHGRAGSRLSARAGRPRTNGAASSSKSSHERGPLVTESRIVSAEGATRHFALAEGNHQWPPGHPLESRARNAHNLLSERKTALIATQSQSRILRRKCGQAGGRRMRWWTKALICSVIFSVIWFGIVVAVGYVHTEVFLAGQITPAQD